MMAYQSMCISFDFISVEIASVLQFSDLTPDQLTPEKTPLHRTSNLELNSLEDILYVC